MALTKTKQKELNDDLIKSSKKGDLEKVNKLLQKGAEIDRYSSCLSEASVYGHLDVVKVLTEHGADVNADDGQSIRWASKNGHLDVVKYLVENGADVNANDGDSIVEASLNGHLELVKYLHQNGADVNADNGMAIYMSSAGGYLDVVKYLVENGADVNVRDGISIVEASKYGQLEVVKYLHQNGADLDKAIEVADENSWKSKPIKEELISYKEELLLSDDLKEVKQEPKSKNTMRI